MPILRERGELLEHLQDVCVGPVGLRGVLSYFLEETLEVLNTHCPKVIPYDRQCLLVKAGLVFPQL